MKNRIIKNMLSMSSLQLVNALFGLSLIPMLISKLGMSIYGEFSVQLAIVTIFCLFIDFGFNFSAVKKISKNEKLKLKNKNIVWNVVFARSIIGIIAAMLYLIYVYRANITEYRFFSIQIISMIITMNFYFMGVQKMHYILWINIINKAFTLVAIYFIQSQVVEKTNLTVIFYSLGYFISSLFSFILCLRFLKKEKGSECKESFMDTVRVSLSFFLSIFLSSIYRYTMLPLLSIYCSSELLGLYSALEKYYKGIQSILNAITQSLYPYFCSTNKVLNAVKYRLVYMFIFVGCFVVFLGTLIFKSFIINDNLQSYLLISATLSLSTFLGICSYFIANKDLISKGMEKKYLISIIFGSICFLVSNAILGFLFKNEMVILSVVLAEMCILISIVRGLINV